LGCYGLIKPSQARHKLKQTQPEMSQPNLKVTKPEVVNTVKRMGLQRSGFNPRVVIILQAGVRAHRTCL